ncbi:hypothetical protein OWV82_010313 [Melia azedarach]|uniref:Uncharacterized protein n=2 Tax=Melia azedarach TaxID=155640 RepID=A0ACC1Y617_MELAZ|nr:hypothetical protein OWV82_010313 [Melia azedarach]KAJ4718663.1 hypothetical protein OWV82_010313 [Melia azedarach]
MPKVTATNVKEYGPGTIAESIKKKLSYMYRLPSQDCSIFRVPKVLLRKNVNAYAPALISIGPYHHGKEGLEAMEALKLGYLYGLLNQLGRTAQKDITLEDLVSGVMQHASHAYSYYEQPLTIEKDKFIEMMVIDGCFILELLLKFVGIVEPDTTDPIFNKPCILDNIRRDLILLENQIPWYLLQVLYIQSVPQDQDKLFTNRDLLNYSLSFLQHTLPVKFNLPEFTQQTFKVEPKHLLDLLYCTIVYSTLVDGSTLIISKDTDDTDENQMSNAWEPVPCVKDLSQAGIKFQKGSESNILSLEFSNGVFKIPPMIIYKHTGCLFFNLIALEQSRYDYEDKIGSYVLFLNSLIKTSGDVHMLRENGIIDNWLGSDEEGVSNFFKNLGQDVYVNNFFHAGLCQNVKKYANTQRQKGASTFRPWMTSLFGAGL